MSPRIFCQLLGLTILVCLSGCASGPAGSGRYVVTAPKSPFYKYGPAQAFGADFALNRGQKVTVVENSFGFSKVQTDDGIAGYMPTDDLAPAPPEPAPQVRSKPRTASRNARGEETFEAPRKGRSQIEAGLPLFDANDVPLPTNGDTPKVELRSPNSKAKKP